VAAEAGLEVLRRGGNAVDAAVTTAFVQGVIDPQMCGIGGCGAMLVHQAAEAKTHLVEFWATAGARVREDQWERLFIREAADRYGFVLEGAVNDVGYQSVGVPGTVAGLAEALRRFGTLSWEQAIAPAIPLARDGFPVSGFMHAYWVTDYGPDVVPNDRRIQATPEARRIYTREGGLYQVGDHFVQADYARTLERLAREGPEDFYRGQIAQMIAADFEANGGSFTAADLAAYRAQVGEPLRGAYRGLELATAGPPAGGLTLLQMLNFLERFDLAAQGWPSAEAARRLVDAMAFAFADRERHLADPRFVEVPVGRLASKEYALAAAPDSPNTTQVSVLDGRGNAVSLTHTLGAASGVVTPGLGFGYNNYLNCFDPRPGRPNSLRPGKTRITMMCPTIGFRDGRVSVVIGAPGGTKIVTGVLQVLVNLVDHGMTPVEAVSAARVDYQAETVQAEGRVPVSVLRGLEAAGYRTSRRTLNYDPYFSRPQLIAVDDRGRARGASDPRKDGGMALEVEA